MAFATVEIVDVIENVCSGAAQENTAYQGQDFEDFRVPGSGLGFGGADAMLRHFVRAGIRYSRHSTSPEGYLPRVGLNGGHSYASYSRSPKRLGEKGKGKGGEASIRQHRLASEVKSIVSSALQQGPYDSALLQRCGFEIEEVKMSGDLRKAFVLWKAMPGMHQTVEKELNAQGKRLRSLVFEQLSMPFSPAIQFRQDKVNPQAQAIDDVLSKLDEESD